MLASESRARLFWNDMQQGKSGTAGLVRPIVPVLHTAMFLSPAERGARSADDQFTCTSVPKCDVRLRFWGGAQPLCGMHGEDRSSLSIWPPNAFGFRRFRPFLRNILCALRIGWLVRLRQRGGTETRSEGVESSTVRSPVHGRVKHVRHSWCRWSSIGNILVPLRWNSAWCPV